MYGSDQSASLEPVGFRKLNSILRSMPEILGNGEKTILKEEELIASRIKILDKTMKTYVFDIDGTICTNTFGKYDLASPFVERIIFINKLYKEGNYIKFFTAEVHQLV